MFKKSHLILDKRQQSGIFILLLLILVVTVIPYFWDFNQPKKARQEKVAAFQARIDSLKAKKILDSKPKIFPFNPNFVTDYKGYALGMTTGQIDSLLRFRESGKWINSAANFQKVTGVPDSLLTEISPYFKFPEWVTNPKPKTKPDYLKNKKTTAQKKDLNKINEADLMNIESMTKDLAVRIVNYRERLGGFLEDDQLFDVYGLKNVLVFRMKDEFTVKTKPMIKKIDVNTANASDLSTVAYITFDMAREIISYRSLHEGITDLDELLKIAGITTYKLDRIKLYLSASQEE